MPRDAEAGAQPVVRDSRRGVVALTTAGLALFVALLWGTSELVSEAATEPEPSKAELCAQHDELMRQLEGGGLFATQAGNHAARRLSVLAERYVEPVAATTDALGANPPVAQVGDDIRTVMSSVAWETRDLVTATRPVALECGWSWPITTTPPAAQPSAPTS